MKKNHPKIKIDYSRIDKKKKDETLEEREKIVIESVIAQYFNSPYEKNTQDGIAKEKYRLFTKADIAVHYAKEHKIKIAIYEENANIEQQYKQNMAVATCIREALIDNRIICHYQPIMNLSTGEISKYETLVRMIDKNNNIHLLPLMIILEYRNRKAGINN